MTPYSISPDSRYLAYYDQTPESASIWILPFWTHLIRIILPGKPEPFCTLAVQRDASAILAGRALDGLYLRRVGLQ